jgi:hypothetical protein
VEVRRKASSLFVSGCLLAGAIAACSSEKLPAGVGGGSAVPQPSQCTNPAEGCECATPGATAECGQKDLNAQGAVICRTGKRTCAGGYWGACDTGPSTASVGNVFASVRPQGLGASTTCSGDPCNPYCSSYNDTATGLTPGPGLAVVDGGVQLQASGVCSTVFTGNVYDPGGNVPLPNVYVFLREGAMAALPQGASQDTCSTILTGGPSGGVPAVRVQTGLDGSFSLPLPPSIAMGTSVDIVVQSGRWRKTLHKTANCMTSTLNDVTGKLKLPSTHDGVDNNIPQFAVVTGAFDTLECFLAKVGVATSEFTAPSGTGRVRMYQGCNGSCGPNLAAGNGGPVPEKSSLIGSQTELNKNSILLLPCEGGNKGDANYGSDADVARVRNFVNAGGRFFATHLSDKYLYHEKDAGGAEDLYPNTVGWKPGFPDEDMFNKFAGGLLAVDANVRTTPPRAQNFRDWLASAAVNGLNGSGRVSFADGKRRSLTIGPQANGWLPNYNTFGFPYYNLEHHVTFDTPVGSANPAGRVVYLSSHVAPTSLRRSGGDFPSECNLVPALTPSERALEYMLFDLSSCVGAALPPPPPIYTQATFTRDFVAQCSFGASVRWRGFEYTTAEPSDTNIVFNAQTADDVAGLATAPSYNISTANAAAPNSPVGGYVLDPDTGTGILPLKGSRKVLRISAIFNPSTDGQSSPSLFTWKQKYDCVQNE